MTKPNKDGWIRHRGGKCPVDIGELVDVKMRCKHEEIAVDAFDLRWEHEGHPEEVMQWRPHKTVEQLIIDAERAASIAHDLAMAPLADKVNEEAEMPAAKYFDGPIQWRDRIRELDDQREEVDALYNRQVAEIKEERASLVAKLKAEGFVLVDSCASECPSVTVSPSIKPGDKVTLEDMSDPANWRVGDLIECINFPGEDGPYTEGRLYEFIEISPLGSARTIDDGGTENGIMPKQFKWHSRPPK